MGHDVHLAAAHARQHIGYCPQANVLFGSLTVLEHLQLFCAIKGLSSGAFGTAAAAASHDIMQAVELQEQQHVRADALSGGMKRRLQVALALLGSSRVILLDEPTSGVDPASRRALWAVLAKYKKGRAMLLTTHFMDEADLLSDSIAIMAEGRLRCWGTPLILKQTYSSGYTLTLHLSLEKGKPPDRQAITGLVCTTVAGAALLRTSGAETVYQLPMESSGSFADLLEALEARSSSLGITHYAMSMPTLEEVFLACTAELSLPEQGADSCSHRKHSHEASPGAVSRALPDCSDGHVAIQMSALNPAAKQGMPQSRLQAAGGSSPSPGGSSTSHQRMEGSCGAASGSIPDRPEKPSMLEEDVAGSSNECSQASDAGAAADDQRLGSIDQPRLSISRDDSAQMLWEQPEETCYSQERDKLQRVSDVQLGHESAVPGPGSNTSSSRHHEEGEAATHDSYTGASSALAADEEAVTDDVSLPKKLRAPRHTQRRQWWIALREMLSKRALITGRDKKGMLFQLLLPLVAICFVLAILKININPTSPSIVLSFKDLLQQDPVIVASPPQYLTHCIVDAPVGAAHDACAAGLTFRAVNATSSFQLSQQLLAEKAAGAPPQYGALVFNDSIIADIAQPFRALNNSLAHMNPASWLALLPLGLPLNPGAAAGSIMAGLSRPEARVISDAVRRFQRHPGVMIMHNASSYHALPALVSGLHQTMGALASNGTAPALTVKSHPLPLTSEESVQLDSLLMVLAALFLLIPFCYLSGSFTLSPVAEEAFKARHLQLLSGCPPFIYWAGSYIWDLMTYAMVVVLSLLVFAAYDDRATTGSLQQLLGTFLLLLLYGAAVIPLGYAYSFSFSSPSAAQVSVAALSFVLGFVAVTGSYVMKLIPKTRALQRVLVHFFRAQPPFLLGEGLIELTRFNFERELALARGGSSGSATDAAVGASSGGEMDLLSSSVFEWGTLGRPLMYLILEAALFFVITLCIDAYGRRGRAVAMPAPLQTLLVRARQSWARALQKLRGKLDEGGGYEELHQQHATVQMSAIAGVPQHVSQELTKEQDVYEAKEAGNAMDEDVDIMTERQRVAEGDADQDTLCLKNLHKTYGSKVVVDSICLGVHRGERFGLLGPNGAGKTTILGMLAGRIQPTSGDALVDGQSIVSSAAHARAALGFCPQQDPLLDLLTGREHLALYARLKGVPEERVSAEVATVLRRTALPREMAGRPAGQYSGGSKRKLALGIALVGGSSTILLDEPSSGMDPGARRAMWNFIIDATEGDAAQGGAADSASCPIGERSAVLTTHSMEECEALCTRVGILDQGRLQCLGSTSHLKLRFGGGYLLEVQAPDDKALQARLGAFIVRELGGQADEERHLGHTKYLLPAKHQSIARVFRLMEEARQALGVQAYGVSLPTLEQVFLRVVGHQLQG